MYAEDASAIEAPVTPDSDGEILNIGPCQPGKVETDLNTNDKQRVSFFILDGIYTEMYGRLQHFDGSLLKFEHLPPKEPLIKMHGLKKKRILY